jgi:FixJ family two-component response regulator
MIERRTIAVVDDDESVRRAVVRALRAAGYRCEAFASAEDLLFCLSTLVPNAVLSDIHLGQMSGLELAVHPAITRRQLPVMIMTGLLDPMFEESARDVAAAFLPKPLCSHDLLEAVVEIVGPPLVEEDETSKDL